MKRNKSFTENKPLLYLVATPIGNLKEMSSRALDIFNDSDIIAAEDTRNTKALLSNYGINKFMFSLREHNEREASEYIIREILNGKKVAYCSDAGYPGISDPGSILVKKCIENDICVSTICGSCAFINALVASGLDTTHFFFYGFLSSKEKLMRDELKELSKRKETIIFYESPHRIGKTLKSMYEILGDREAVIARELTKLNEEYIRGKLGELVNINSDTLIGEMVIIVSGCHEEIESVSDQIILDRIRLFKQKGMSLKDAVEIASIDYNDNKNRLYKLALQNLKEDK